MRRDASESDELQGERTRKRVQRRFANQVNGNNLMLESSSLVFRDECNSKGSLCWCKWMKQRLCCWWRWRICVSFPYLFMSAFISSPVSSIDCLVSIIVSRNVKIFCMNKCRVLNSLLLMMMEVVNKVTTIDRCRLPCFSDSSLIIWEGDIRLRMY